MGYRERLYGSYVSSNRGPVYAAFTPARRALYGRGLQLRFKEWLRPVDRGSPVADLGCGAGFLIDWLKAMGFTDITGADFSDEQVALGRERGLKVVKADAMSFLEGYPDGYFGLITAFDILEHLNRDEIITLLDRIREKLRPGGVFLYQMPNGDSPFVGAIYFGDATHETLLNAISLRHLLTACGFERMEFQETIAPPIRPTWAVRWVLWKGLRFLIRCCHRIETGGFGTGYYTRVIRGVARKAENGK